jgi:hypothetical protein
MTPIKNQNAITVPVTYSGVYLFQAPHQLQLTVDKGLAVVFCLNGLPAAGLVLYQSDLSLKELLSELELLHLKIKSKVKIHTDQITLKLFGLSTGAFHIFDTIKEWADNLGIAISVTELGKRMVRNLVVDCETGKVAVTFGDLNSRNSKPEFLSLGTARSRIPLSKVHNKILILTHNQVQRQLTKAAVEEHPAWAAEVIEDVRAFLKTYLSKDSTWSVVLCFEDLSKDKGIAEFISQIQLNHPSTEIRWVGSKVPQFLDETNTKLLPPIDYALLPDFKKMLKRAVFDANLAMNFEAVKLSQSKKSR